MSRGNDPDCWAVQVDFPTETRVISPIWQEKTAQRIAERFLRGSKAQAPCESHARAPSPGVVPQNDSKASRG